MKRTKIEQLLVVIAWMGLIGGILFTALVSKGIMESKMEMAFPQAVLTFVGGIGASVIGWAVLMQIISLSDRIRNIENHLSNYSNS
jgi:tellurite resistance protein TehA-like permease